MAIEFYIHKMTEHMETARIVRWLAKEGSFVTKGQAILEVETEKAVSEVESPGEGFLKGIREGATEGSEINVGEIIAYIAQEGEVVLSLPAINSLSGAAGKTISKSESKPGHEQGMENIRATPAARRMAKEKGIELNTVVGTGEVGSIREQDILAFSTKKTANPDFEWIELTSIQKTTAMRMTESLKTIPQFFTSVSIDLSNVLQWKNNLVDDDPSEIKQAPTLTALLVFALAKVLKNFPLCNASFQNEKVKAFKRININVAIGTDNGLFAPVIKAADKKTIGDITDELSLFKKKALQNHFNDEDLSDGTFTLSNLGMYGVDQFTAIINPPQSAILAIGRIREEIHGTGDNQKTNWSRANFTLSADHRVLDGLYAANFLSALRDFLEKWQTGKSMFGDRI
jgi:pyruvate dehydrogenase E2 component (dihydrolipoamide acetyltransferase)